MLSFILNLPFTLAGLFWAVISVSSRLSWRSKPYAIICKCKSFWWAKGCMTGARAMTVGHTVLLGPSLEEGDLEHELIHVEQYERMPIIFLVLYYVELFKKGYRNNTYEVEAYKKAGNVYKGSEALFEE